MIISFGLVHCVRPNLKQYRELCDVNPPLSYDIFHKMGNTIEPFASCDEASHSISEEINNLDGNIINKIFTG